MPNNPAETPESEKPIKIGVADDFSREKLDRRVSVAPMMDWTDRHCRYFLRGYSPRVLLYTEMITAAAITRGDRAELLLHSPEEHPLALQLGGSDAAQLAAAARAGADSGYDEINLNCGCPSERVQAGAFGACLMLEPERVADAVAAMQAAVAVPVTVKTRIGVVAADDARGAVAEFTERDLARLRQFITTVMSAGCRHFIVHARKAVLAGLSPAENRSVPPLRLDIVRSLKQEFPQLSIVLNGGLRTAQQCLEALAWCDGIMLGREAYHRPEVLAQLHAHLYRDGWSIPDAACIIERMADYIEREVASGTPFNAISRHMMGLANGRPGARRYRQMLSGARWRRGPDAVRDGARAAALLRDAGRCCSV
jgi:tRNA-dihydrouridine synthase A